MDKNSIISQLNRQDIDRRRGYRERRVEASSEQILEAARHLAAHYLKAGKALPDTLAALG
jgi:hypothetical protein